MGSAALKVVKLDIFLVSQMKGERKMLERLLQTEIAMLRAIRDGSALMQHMEDFYYIALLEVIPSLSLSFVFLGHIRNSSRKLKLIILISRVGTPPSCHNPADISVKPY